MTRATGTPIGPERELPAWVTSALSEGQTAVPSLRWRWRQLVYATKLSAAAKATALAIAHHCTEDRLWSFPGQALLARETGFSKASVIRATKELERAGFILIHRRRDQLTNRQQVNVYGLALPNLMPSDLFEPGCSVTPGVVAQGHPGSLHSDTLSTKGKCLPKRPFAEKEDQAYVGPRELPRCPECHKYELDCVCDFDPDPAQFRAAMNGSMRHEHASSRAQGRRRLRRSQLRSTPIATRGPHQRVVR